MVCLSEVFGFSGDHADYTTRSGFGEGKNRPGPDFNLGSRGIAAAPAPVLDIVPVRDGGGVGAPLAGCPIRIKLSALRRDKEVPEFVERSTGSLTATKQGRHPRESGGLYPSGKGWMPAFAGMTQAGGLSLPLTILNLIRMGHPLRVPVPGLLPLRGGRGIPRNLWVGPTLCASSSGRRYLAYV